MTEIFLIRNSPFLWIIRLKLHQCLFYFLYTLGNILWYQYFLKFNVISVVCSHTCLNFYPLCPQTPPHTIIYEVLYCQDIDTSQIFYHLIQQFHFYFDHHGLFSCFICRENRLNSRSTRVRNRIPLLNFYTFCLIAC